MIRPTPRSEEIHLDKFRYIMSRTDARGYITFANDYFCEISGYSSAELIGKPHSIIRHPDMPRLIFKLMWERLKEGKPITAVVKNMAKDGRYYWVTTKFEMERDLLTKQIKGYIAYRQAAKPTTVALLSELYDELLKAEKEGGIEASQQKLDALLASKKMDYDQYIDDVIEHNHVMSHFFTAMRKMFN